MSKKKLLIFGIGISILISGYTQVDDYFEVSKNLDIFSTVYKEVNLSYVDDVKPGHLMREAIDAMLKSLDPYTNFYSEAQAEDYRFQVTGSYGGIGAIVKKHGDDLVIDRPYQDYPAQKSGLRAGDVLIKVDGKSVIGKTSSQLSDVLKGTAGTTVVLTITRPEKGEMEVTLKRAQVKVKNVPYYGMINKEVGYLKLTGFTPDAGLEVQNAVKNLKEQGALSIVFDLRGNGGGLLHEAVNIVNVFVKKGQLVVSTKGKEKEKDRVYKTLNAPLDEDIPLVVLVDGGSASASEIVSGTIQDLDRGVVVGTQSYGKGLVQSTRLLSFNTQMKITTAKYYIPSGRCIQRLDYSKKKNGNAISIADSLKQTFYTSNKRRVTDGEGVNPDVKVGLPKLTKIAKSLVTKYLIFDYATHYRNAHDTIVSPKEFHLTDADYTEFKTFIKDKDYGYVTDTENALKDLEKKADDEHYIEAIQSNIDALREVFNVNKNADLDKHKTEIVELLETEIASRYYYDRAFVETTFDDDSDVQEAITILKDKGRYVSILSGK
ncbi:MAG: S41 family peptidase [Bacteroidetes bacterium]|jgi:carboxyl-terminal processing protease|nr:S41 family peptidase [Bacteroidota bacterium]